MADRESVEDRIAESALQLLRTGGPRSVTVEAVTAHSGIAKTTIYRRHRDRREMLAAVLSRLVTPAPLPVQADTPQRFRWIIRHAIGAIDDGIGFGGFASLLTDDDTEFNTLFRQILVDQRAQLVSVIDASVADGSMRGDIDSQTLLDAIVGAHVADRARNGQFAEDWEDRLFDLFWPTVAS